MEFGRKFLRRFQRCRHGPKDNKNCRSYRRSYVEATNKYMAETVLVDEDYVGVRHDCFNTSTDELCAFKAARDKCNMTGNYEDLEDELA